MNIFEVESIMDSRTKGGNTEYKVRWKGYSSSNDTWEPLSNLDCSELIDEYEKKIQSFRAGDNAKMYSKHHNKKQCQFMHDEAKRSFDLHGKPDEIIGSSIILGEHVFLVKWRDEKATLIPNLIATTKIPMMVIEYYESLSKTIDLPSDLKKKPN